MFYLSTTEKKGKKTPQNHPQNPATLVLRYTLFWSSSEEVFFHTFPPSYMLGTLLSEMPEGEDLSEFTGMLFCNYGLLLPKFLLEI